MANPDSPPDFTDCPFWGVGGRYVVDPDTGKRVPVPPEISPVLSATPADQLNETPAKKGK